MLTIGGKDLLKRWHYPNNVTDVYLGVHHIWPSFNPYYFFGIKVPGGSTANEGVPDSAYDTSGNITINIDAAGTSGTISVRSRYYVRNNEFEWVNFDNDGPSEATADWWYVSPGAGETFGYTINKNTTSSVRTAVLKITQATTGNVITVNIVQQAGSGSGTGSGTLEIRFAAHTLRDKDGNEISRNQNGSFGLFPAEGGQLDVAVYFVHYPEPYEATDVDLTPFIGHIYVGESAMYNDAEKSEFIRNVECIGVKLDPDFPETKHQLLYTFEFPENTAPMPIQWFITFNTDPNINGYDIFKQPSNELVLGQARAEENKPTPVYVMQKTSTDPSTSITFPGGTSHEAVPGFICCYSTKDGVKQPVTASSDSTWLTVSENNSLPYDGANYNFKFDQTENTSTSSRTGKITITQNDSNKKVVWTIVQKGKPEYPILVGSKVSFDPTFIRRRETLSDVGQTFSYQFKVISLGYFKNEDGSTYTEGITTNIYATTGQVSGDETFILGSVDKSTAADGDIVTLTINTPSEPGFYRSYIANSYMGNTAFASFVVEFQ